MNGSVMRKFGAGAVIFVIYVCLYLLTILPRGGFITLFGLTGFSLSQLLGATVLFAATLLLQTITRYKYRKWYFLIVALLPFVPEVIVYIAGSAPYTAVPDTVFKVTAVIIAWYAGGFYGGGCGEINGKNASGAYGNINSVHASNNEAYRGFRMYVQEWKKGKWVYFPSQGLRTMGGRPWRNGMCGNYHTSSASEGGRVNIFHLHTPGEVDPFETSYGYSRRAVGGPVRCVRDVDD